MEIQLRYEATVVGRVIDEQGNPIQRATIYYFVSGEGLGHNVTDVDGRYRLTGLDPQYLNYELMADHPDYAYKYQGIQISTPVEVQAPDMVLKKGRNISGVVTDEASKPIPFATVEHGGFHGQVKTDLQGRYRLKNIPDSISRIRAYALGFAPVLKEISDKQQDSVADFVLGKGYTLSGQVTDVEGKPLKDAFVGLYIHNWPIPLIPGIQTDEAGRFTINNVPAGEIQLYASKDGYNAVYTQHKVMEDAQNLSLSLTSKSAFQFKIKVVDAETNQAIPAFEWALTESPGSKHRTVSQPRYELRQSADGTLEYFANEAGKIYDVFVRTEGYAPAVVREVRAVSQNEAKTVIVKLQRPAVVEGKVVADATGTPVPNARVQAFNEDHPITVSNDEEFNRPGYATAFTDANGRFSINVIFPASDYLYITHPEVGAAVVTIADIGNSPIRLIKDASIHGQVLQDGKPVSGAHVYIEDIPLGVQQESKYPLRHEMHIWTSEDGRFTFEHLLPGEYTVIWNNRSRKLELSAGETATITYGEAGGVDVFGTVRDESSKAVEGITVLIPQQGSAETDEQGKYIIHDVPPGKYQIFAFSVRPPIKLPFKNAFKEEIEVPKGRERFQFDIVIKLEDVQ
jgi:protocatechuate 3,4-dioxygenase beta subunit